MAPQPRPEPSPHTVSTTCLPQPGPSLPQPHPLARLSPQVKPIACPLSSPVCFILPLHPHPFGQTVASVSPSPSRMEHPQPPALSGWSTPDPWPRPARPERPCPAPGPRSPLAAVRSCEQPPRGYQHCATVELVVLKHQRGLPRLRVRRAVRPVDDAAATAVVLPGVLCSPRPEGLGARRGAAGGRGAVAGSNVVCKCRL